MNNEQANTNTSTVDVEEKKDSTESSVEVQDVASEAEAPEAVQAASTTDPESDEREDVPSSEAETTAGDTDSEQAETSTDDTASEEVVEATVSEADSEEVAELTDDTAPEEEVVEATVSEADAEQTEDTTPEEVEVAVGEADAEPATTEPTDEATPEVAVAADGEQVAELTDASASEEEASAPEEPPEPMSAESLEEAYDNSIKAFTDGEIVKGVVVDVTRDEVMIDIGFKSEGYIPASEFDTGENDLPAVQVSDEIDVYIVRREDAEGQIVLSKKIADQTLIWDEIATAHEANTPVKGRITERIKGGLRVTIGSLRGFLRGFTS